MFESVDLIFMNFKKFYLYFSGISIFELLNSARSYRIALTLALLYWAQMEQINGALFTIQNFMNKRSIVHLSQASSTYSKNLNLVASSDNSNKGNTRERIASDQKLQLNQTVPTCQWASVGPLPDLQTAHTCLPTSIRSARCSLAHPIGICLISSDAPTQPTPDSIGHRSRVLCPNVPCEVRWWAAMAIGDAKQQRQWGRVRRHRDSSGAIRGRPWKGVEMVSRQQGQGEEKGEEHGSCVMIIAAVLRCTVIVVIVCATGRRLTCRIRGSRMGAVVPWSTAVE